MDLDFRLDHTGTILEPGSRSVGHTKSLNRSIVEAQARAAAQEQKRIRDFANVIDGEAGADGFESSSFGTGDLSSEQIRQRAIDRLENAVENAALDIARIEEHVHFKKQYADAVASSLYRLHLQCGSLLEELEKIAGRQFEAPRLQRDTLELDHTGGYRVCPVTGVELDPFAHYREPVPRQSVPSDASA